MTVQEEGRLRYQHDDVIGLRRVRGLLGSESGVSDLSNRVFPFVFYVGVAVGTVGVRCGDGEWSAGSDPTGAGPTTTTG